MTLVDIFGILLIYVFVPVTMATVVITSTSVRTAPSWIVVRNVALWPLILFGMVLGWLIVEPVSMGIEFAKDVERESKNRFNRRES